MKVFKDKQHSLFMKPFAIDGQDYLGLGVFIFFELSPSCPVLTEQELWKSVPAQLGAQVLDMGMVKPTAELLVWGRAHAPQGRMVQGLEIELQVGEINKRLAVFGDRFWHGRGDTASISEPVPFSSMPIDWAHAFGGPEFARNPLGRGIAVQESGERQRVLLPNIEYPRHLIDSPASRPEPAGFTPLDMMWPQRADKNGTYDQKWLQQHWPDFPADMDYKFFNMAPADQQLQGFWQGNENIRLTNMHPKQSIISSGLPGSRPRLFLTRATSKVQRWQDEQPRTRFEEVNLHRETLWLFPEILRGLLIWRGSCQIADDAYQDVLRVLIRSEQTGEAKKPLDYYLEEQKRVMDRMVPVDMAPFEQAQKEVDRALLEIGQIPKQIDKAKKLAAGRAPLIARTPQEIEQMAGRMAEGHYQTLDRLQAMTQKMHAKWGHLVEIDLGIFDRMRAKIDQTMASVAKTASHLGKEKAKLTKLRDEGLKQACEQVRSEASSEDLQKNGLDASQPFSLKQKAPWQKQGFDFVTRARRNLEQEKLLMQKLTGTGLVEYSLAQAWIGWNPGPEKSRYEDWGLDEQKSEFVIPAGWVLPVFEEEKLVRIQILAPQQKLWDSGEFVPGSKENTIFYPAVNQKAPVIRVRGELEALLAEQEAGDFCSVLALPAVDSQLDKQVEGVISQAERFLVLMGEHEQQKDWQQTWPEATIVGLPENKKSVLQFRAAGLKLRSWLKEQLPDSACLPPEVGLPDGKTTSKIPGQGIDIPFPELDIAALVKKSIFDMQAVFDPQRQQAKDMRQAMYKEIEDEFKRRDLKVPPHSKVGQPPDFKAMADKAVSELEKRKNVLSDSGRLNKELAADFDKKIVEVRQVCAQAGQRYEKAMSRLAARQKELESKKIQAGNMQPPPQTVKALQEAGLDPQKAKILTRQQVIEQYAKNRDLSGCNLNGLDLSGLELPEVNLSRAQCQKTIFKGCNLQGAVLDQILAMKADFSQADLSRVRVQRGVLQKARLQKARLKEANLYQCLAQEADLAEADLQKARLDRVVFQGANLSRANLEQVRSKMGVYMQAELKEAIFEQAELEKCLFQRSGLDKTVFSRSRLDSCMFYGSRGQDTVFTKAELVKLRVGGKAALPGIDFRNARLVSACLRDSDLNGALFEGATLESCMFEGCNLEQSDFFLVPAKRCRFMNCNLERAEMRGMNLMLGSLRKTRLVGTDLSDSNLFGVDMYKAELGSTKLDRANLKMTILYERTRFLDK